MFRRRFRSTPLGARLARKLAADRLDAWGIPYGSERGDVAALVVGELAANAATHGRVPGRSFEVRMTLRLGYLRVEVSDTRTERRPALVAPQAIAERGRGLFLVSALADAWGVLDRIPVGKTVWAEVSVDEQPPNGPA
ncbi:ATP-binding protein [Streptomyces coeruleoprunus]